MTNIDPKLVDEVFCDALDLPQGERATFVDAKCAGDEALARRVMQLLDASVAPGGHIDNLIEESRQQLLGTFVDAGGSGEDLSGKVIGSWRIEKPLARGGLATVYVAHRDDGQYQQRVAFKVLRRGLDTDDVVARFRAERQILSAMEHSAIAQILDGGTLEDGRPYLVLEFVDGLSITEYCDVNDSSVRDRVRLTIDVLKALQHAHQHLVVHRDIKPTNIMVSKDGRVSLLDFGIAKLLDPTAMPGGSTLTRTGVALLTPRYGSPEQHMCKPVTTASDIYQAGGILYELLSGEPPQNGAEMTAHTAFSPPSRAIRGTARHALIKGDLDAIVSKAMQVDPLMRYPSAEGMVADLERFLDGKPVLARPDTFFYRSYKLMRRQPLILPGLLVLLITVTGYIVILNKHNRDIRIEQQRAEAAQEFMVDLLGSANPYGRSDRDRGKEILVVDALEVGLQRLRSGDYGGDEKLRAALMGPIADVYSNLNKEHEAIQIRQEVLAIELMTYGEVSKPVMLSARELAGLYRTIGSYSEAEKYYAQQLFLAEQLFSINSAEVAIARSASAVYEMRRENMQRAIDLLVSAVKTLQKNPQEYARELIVAIVSLARARVDQDLDDTLTKLVEAMQLADTVFGSDTALAGLARTQYATSLTVAGEYAAAERYFNEAIGIYEAKLGRDHGATLIALINLGRLYDAMGDLTSAELVFREVYGHYLRIYGAHQGGTAESGLELGKLLVKQERFSEGIDFLQRASEAYLAVLGENADKPQWPMVWIALAQQQMGDLAAAQAIAALAVERLDDTRPDSDMAVAARCLLQQIKQNAAGSEAASAQARVCLGSRN